MFSQQQSAVLSFDDNTFRLRPGASGRDATPKDRVIEEGLETILFYWANHLLPTPRLLMLARSNPLLPEQDLLAVDDLGRVHVFELKEHTAGREAFHQLLSYLAGRPRDDVHWLTRGLADVLWYGEQRTASYLAGLVARRRIATAGTEASRQRARGEERHDALVTELSRSAAERSALQASPEGFRAAAMGLVKDQFGGRWSGPLADPRRTFSEITAARLPRYWRLGLTHPGIVPWIVAPGIGGARQEAPAFTKKRRLEVRCVSLDVRETVAGREWSIEVGAPEGDLQRWQVADSFAGLIGQVLERHLQDCPDASERVRVELPPDLRPGETGISWTAGGPTKLSLKVLPDCVEVGLYYDWWTEGAAIAMRDTVHRISRKVRARHPRSWAWSPQEPPAGCNREMVEGLASTATDYWQSLRDAGVLDLDEWAYFMPPDDNRTTRPASQ